MKALDLTGQRFGRLLVLGFAENRKRSDGHYSKYWHCLCQCGAESFVSTSNLRSGKVKSCGCLTVDMVKEANTVHGFRHRNEKPLRLYRIWNCMKTRCNNKNRKDYKLYGERGISVCQDWEHDFYAFYDWAIQNGYKDDLTLDRIDVNGDYCPQNCKWSTAKEQANNTRKNIKIELFGITKSLKQWTELMNWKYGKYENRHRKGHPIFSDEEIKLIEEKLRSDLCGLQTNLQTL